MVDTSVVTPIVPTKTLHAVIAIPVAFAQAPPPNPAVSAAITVENIGDGPFALTVANLTAGTYRAHVGPLGTIADPQVYNGRPGSGGLDIIFQTSGSNVVASASIWLPPMPIGGPYSFTFVPQPSGTALVSDPIVTVIGESFSSKTLSLRRLYPPWLAAGPRAPRAKIFPQV